MEISSYLQMEISEYDHNNERDEDFCNFILQKFPNTNICTTIVGIYEELKYNNVPISTVSYLGAILTSLERLSLDPFTPTHALDSLFLLLSLLLPKVSNALLVKNNTFLFDLLVRVLRGGLVSEEGLVSCFECLSHLLLIHGSSICDHRLYLHNSFDLLLGYVTHTHPKVRSLSQDCIRDLLRSFQDESSSHTSASKAFACLLRELLIANATPAAADIVHVLEALKHCLPYISLTYKSSILKTCNSLLSLRNPLVTRLIADTSYTLGVHPTLELDPQVLLDHLCLLALSNPVDASSPDCLTFTARLLDVGIRKVHLLDRDICVLKLPLVLNFLQGIFGSGFEEAKHAATEAMKNLIHACIDDGLIKDVLNRIKTCPDPSNNFTPSILENLCATVGSLIDNRYRDEWDMAFQVISLMFDKLGEASFVLMRGTLENLANIEKESGEDFPERKQLHRCIGSALEAMGPEVFLSILPLKLQANVLSEINGWLFPILKQYTIGARLGFYIESILRAVQPLQQKSYKLTLEGKIQSSRAVDSVIYHIWSLLPSFCNYSSDTSESFIVLKKVMHNALIGEPDIHGIICSSLQILIKQNSCVLKGTSNFDSDKRTLSCERAIMHYSKEVAFANLTVLKSSVADFFNDLYEAYSKSINDHGGSLLATIGELTSIADENDVSKFFRTRMSKLLDSSEQIYQFKNKSAQLLDLAASVLPGLGIPETETLFHSIESALRAGAAAGLIQKKVYKVLSMLLKNSNEFIARRPQQLVNLMNDVLPSCHFSSKRYRLDCLYHLIVYIAKHQAELEMVEIISSLVAEIILALKEANKKTRNRADDVLVQVGHAFEDEHSNGVERGLPQFFQMVAKCLDSESPFTISAAVKGLARLTYEFSDLLTSAYEVLPRSFLLLQTNNGEIIKANLGLFKVLVAKSQPEKLLNHLKAMVEGLLKFPCETKNHFNAKVKCLLEMLIKKCGLDSVKAVMPEEHMKLLTNLCKIKERRDKKLAANSETGSYLSKATTSRQSRWGHTKIFSDFSERTSDDGISVGRRSLWSSKKSRESSLRKSRKSRKMLSEDLHNNSEDEPLDLLDQRKTRLSLRSCDHSKRKRDSDDDELDVDEGGKLIIREGKQNFERSFDQVSDDYRRDVANFAPKQAGKRRKTIESGWTYTGKVYASKKARGDVTRKGKLEPYAYWPLDRKMLSRRPEHRACARRGMASVVKMTKRLEGKSVASGLALNVWKKSKKVHKKR